METASAVVADMVSVIGTTGTGFLQNDACWRELEPLPSAEMRSPYYVRIDVDDVAGVLAQVALRLAAHRVSVARLVQHQEDGSATLHVVTHEGAEGDLRARSRRSSPSRRRRARPRRCRSSPTAASPASAGPEGPRMTTPLAERYRDRLPLD